VLLGLYLLGSFAKVKVFTHCYEGMLDLTKIKFHSWELNDICAFELPEHFPTFKCLTERFIRQSDIKKMSGRATLWLPSRTRQIREIVASTHRQAEVMRWASADPDVSDTYSALCYVFKMQTNPGDCGSLYSINMPALGARTLFGLHCAGTGENAYANIMTQEFLCHIFTTFHPLESGTEKLPPVEIAQPQSEKPKY
jgi:hypothetical protein